MVFLHLFYTRGPQVVGSLSKVNRSKVQSLLAAYLPVRKLAFSPQRFPGKVSGKKCFTKRGVTIIQRFKMYIGSITLMLMLVLDNPRIPLSTKRRKYIF